eukprot:SAG22_NODE_16782_length_318_cov_0.589041_1_plen_70_part_01
MAQMMQSFVPVQTSHSSVTLPPPHTPLQSIVQSLAGSASQPPQWSSTSGPFGTPLQSAHVEFEPPQTAQA